MLKRIDFIVERCEQVRFFLGHFARLVAEPGGAGLSDRHCDFFKEAPHCSFVCQVLAVDETAGVGVMRPGRIFEQAQLVCEVSFRADVGIRNFISHVVDGIVAFLPMEREVTDHEEVHEMTVCRLRFDSLGNVAKTVLYFTLNVADRACVWADLIFALVLVVGESKSSKK